MYYYAPSAARFICQRSLPQIALCLSVILFLEGCKESPKQTAPSTSETHAVSIQWNEPILFKTDGPIVAAATGFPVFQENGAWTEGNVATVNLTVPHSSADLELTAEITPFLDPKQTPPQAAKIVANDVSVGEWQFTSTETTQRKIIIPHACLAEGTTLALRFEIANPTSPKSLGQGDDGRLLGLFFSKIGLTESKEPAVSLPVAAKAPVGEPGTAAIALGRILAFNAKSPVFAQKEIVSGFATPQENGAWTDGATAIVHLTIPSTSADLKLTALVEPFLIPNQTPGQIVEVLANGEPVGQWEFVNKETAKRQCVIPQKALTKGARLDLRFNIAKPASPSSLGLGNDGRNLGIFFSGITLEEAK